MLALYATLNKVEKVTNDRVEAIMKKHQPLLHPGHHTQCLCSQPLLQICHMKLERTRKSALRFNFTMPKDT